LKQSKQEEKDTKEIQKKKIDEFSGHLKKMEKQKLELLNAFKKQQTVIDGLKKQKVCYFNLYKKNLYRKKTGLDHSALLS